MFYNSTSYPSTTLANMTLRPKNIATEMHNVASNTFFKFFHCYLARKVIPFEERVAPYTKSKNGVSFEIWSITISRFCFSFADLGTLCTVSFNYVHLVPQLSTRNGTFRKTTSSQSRPSLLEMVWRRNYIRTIYSPVTRRWGFKFTTVIANSGCMPNDGASSLHRLDPLCQSPSVNVFVRFVVKVYCLPTTLGLLWKTLVNLSVEFPTQYCVIDAPVCLRLILDCIACDISPAVEMAPNVKWYSNLGTVLFLW